MTDHIAAERAKKWTIFILHILILGLSIFLITLISIDTFKNESFYTRPQFQRWQFYICMVFLFDFFFEWILAPRKAHYFVSHLFFLFVSIPYQAILYHYGWHLSEQVEYLVRYIPLVRGGYALAIVVGWFTANKATGLFWTYLIFLIASVYFASLTFFLFEYGVNPLVQKYQDALWWAAMDVTTVGSNIVAVTGVGRVLSVVLAALGMMMFPIFTVYITNIITQRNKEAKSFAAMLGANSGNQNAKDDNTGTAANTADPDADGKTDNKADAGVSSAN